MRGDGHVGGLCLQDAVDRVHVALRHLVDVDALGGVRFALGRVAELAPAGVVELQVAAAQVVEGAHGVAVYLNDVVEEHRLVGIALDGAVRGLAAHAGDEVQHGGRGDGQLHGVIAGDVAQLGEMGQERVVAEGDLVAERQLSALGLGALELDRPRFGVDVLDVLQALQEVEVPHGAAELAVGDGLEARLLFLLHQVRNGGVLGGGQLLARDGSGGEIGAREGTLSIMVGGDENVFARVKPLFDILGKNITLVGGNGDGQTCKVANQIIVALNIEAVSEALVFASKAGADPARVRQALMGGFASSRILEVHGERMLNRTFNPGFKISLHQKDLNLALQSAKALALNLPNTATCQELFNTCAANGGSELDHSSLVQALELMANHKIS